MSYIYIYNLYYHYLEFHVLNSYLTSFNPIFNLLNIKQNMRHYLNLQKHK